MAERKVSVSYQDSEYVLDPKSANLVFRARKHVRTNTIFQMREYF